MADMAVFNAYTTIVAERLIGEFPEWRELAVLDTRPGASPGALLLEVPCPSAAVQEGLWISTNGDEITVGFHTHHVHFADYEGLDSNAHIEGAVQYIQGLLADEFLVESWYCEAAFCGSATVRPDAPTALPDFISGVMHMTRRSWSGARDAEMPAADLHHP